MIDLPSPVATNAMILLSLTMKAHFSNFYCILQFEDDFVVRNISQHGNYYLRPGTELTTKHAQKFDLCLGIVINMQSEATETFEMFEEFIQKHSNVRFRERKYIVTFRSEQDDAFRRFFASKYLQFVSDVLVIKEFADRQGVFGLYTHRFVGVEGNENIILLDEWNAQAGAFRHNADLFPDKFKNLEGKRLVVGGEKYLPITDPVNIKGPETMILMEYATRHNVTLVFDRSFDFLGVRNRNWTGTGYIGKLLDDTNDIIAYAVYINADRTRFADFSHPLCEIRVTCLVPKPSTINNWMIINIFTYVVWLIIGATLIVIMIFIKMLKCYYRSINDHTMTGHEYLLAFRILTAQPSQLDGQKHVERFAFSILLACFILIQTYFNSKLSSYVAVPTFIDDINTLHDLASSDIYWYSKFNDKGTIISTETTEPLVTLHKKFRFLEGDIDQIEDTKFAYAVDESFASHFFTIDDYFTPEDLEPFKVMKEYIIGHQYTAFLLRRNSVWLKSIDDLCSKAMEQGLVKFWEKDSISEPQERKIQNYLGLSRDSKETPAIIQLDLRFFKSTFIIWCGGLGISLIVFVLEFIQI